MPKSRKNQPNNKKRQRSTKKQHGGEIRSRTAWLSPTADDWYLNNEKEVDNQIKTVLKASDQDMGVNRQTT